MSLPTPTHPRATEPGPDPVIVHGPAYRAPWDDSPPAAPAGPIAARDLTVQLPAPESAPPRRGRRPNPTHAVAGEAPTWRYHHLTVSGPSQALAEFASAARGAGVIPWRFDGERFEEDVFHRAATVPAAQRGLSIDGCHRLARQFRLLVEAHQSRAAAAVGRGKDCPFDLQALLPVPAHILALGANHPDALAWLAAHWGVADRLRQVTVRAGATVGHRLPRGHAVIGYGFFTAGDCPHRAVAALAERFPLLRFALAARPVD